MSYRTAALSLALLLFALPRPAAAAEPWDGAPFAGDPAAIARAAAAVQAPPDADVVVLLSEQTFRFDRRGRVTTRSRLVYKVITSAGAASWGAVTESWSPWSENQPTVSARVIDPSGRVSRLDPGAVTASPATASPRMQSERRTVSAPLPGIAPGAVVEELREVVEHRPAFAAGATRTVWFRSSVPVHRTRVILDAPKSRPVRWRGDALGFKPTRARRGDRVILTFDTDRTRTPADRDAWQPPRLDAEDRLSFTTGRSWKQVARSYAALVDKQIAAGPPPVLPVPKGADRAATIEAILAAVRAQVRATEHDLQQSSPVPWTPAETWQRGYGDSKDLATLLVALLRAAGIDARVALVARGYDADVPDLPGLGLFDTALVYLPGKRPTWIQPAARDNRAGELTMSAQDRSALVVAPRTARLIRTPPPTDRTNRYEEVREIHLDDYGAARVVETTRFTGRPERSYRDQYRTSKAADLSKVLSGYIADQYQGTLKGYRTSDPDDLSKPFELTLEIDAAGDLRTDFDEAKLYLRTGPTLEQLPTILRDADRAREADRRTRPLHIIEPYTYELTYRVHLPDGWRVGGMPQAEVASLGPIRIASSFEQRGSVVVGRVVTTQPARELSADDLRTARRKLQEYLASPAAVLTLEHAGVTDVTRGNALRGLATLRRLIAAQPKRAIQRSRMATVLIQLGLQRAALAEAEKAVALDGSSVSYGMLGWVNDHDELGRIYGPGWNRAGAIAAYRKALKLDPSHEWVRGNLALTLLRDADGIAYAGDLDAAIAEMLEMRRQKVDSHDEELMTAMVHAGRFAELRELTLGMPASDLRNRFLVAAVAAADGIDAARSQAEQLAPAKLERSGLLSEAAGRLSAARHYPAARALLLEARSLGVDRSLQATAEVVGKARPYPQQLGKPGDPARVARLVLAAMFGAAGGPDRHDKLRSSTARALGTDPIFDLGSRYIRRMVRENGVLPAAAADVLLAQTTFTPTVTKLAVVVAVDLPGRPTSRTYLRRHRRGYQLVSAFGWAPPLAAEALDRARRGDRRGAEQWLAWAADELAAGNNQGVTGSASAFKVLWNGRRADEVEDLERAAAALLTEAAPARAAGLLGSCKTGDPQLNEACWQALFRAALHGNDAPLMKRALAGWSAAAPSEDRFWEALAAKKTAGDWAAVERDLRARAARQPNDPRLDRELVQAQCEATPDPSCITALAALAAKSGTSWAHNQHAWQALMFDQHDDAILASARKGVELTGGGAADLNTLAAVQAARGELTDARATLVRVFDALHGQVRDADWLVHGKIAAEAGYPGVARAAFRRVVKPPVRSAFDSYALMQHWRGQLPR